MKIFLVFISILVNIFAQNLKSVYNYKVIHKNIIYHQKPYILIRSFNIDNKRYYLAVNSKNLITKIIENKAFLREETEEKSRYEKVLSSYSKAPFNLQNYGLKKLDSKNIFLTMDMCPSSKIGYEDGFLAEIISKYKTVPITFFISGRWIEKHKKEFLELRELQKERKLDITWGNHTFNHFYYPNCSLEKNFILAPKTDLKKEILDLEKLLISYDITPSILFRFPGLVSDKKSISIIKELGLISVGSNAWLAKDEVIKEGSIILLHGNKNEPKGIEKARDFLIKKDDFNLGSILQEL
ncbi:polysaccharide deacetylase family protein [Halarcobacter ebronensis]|uniref:NodB homology domain-containing protein n=1 Tax=Halarcobacter ebronensis TaxID=1462615 RepID=A0A4Q1AJS9_9BACT|nr:polysaccharide deacetylase family protein [Halarcobacter ebronensis]QKF81731.1 polysaccharide deacetylase [Halarcobacter ebronensis]RXK04591.1 hypothetical protein CRV07_10575 [Halarcobacter ebronensis]